METLENNIISIILWLIVVCISIRHLYVNWRVFKLAYRNVQFVSLLISLPLLFASIWSNNALIAFLVASLMLSYMKVYKSRVERGSFIKKIDDKFLLIVYPTHKEETLNMFRAKVYVWHCAQDLVALALVCGVGAVLDHVKLIVAIVKMF